MNGVSDCVRSVTRSSFEHNSGLAFPFLPYSLCREIELSERTVRRIQRAKEEDGNRGYGNKGMTRGWKWDGGCPECWEIWGVLSLRDGGVESAVEYAWGYGLLSTVLKTFNQPPATGRTTRVTNPLDVRAYIFFLSRQSMSPFYVNLKQLSCVFFFS